MSAIQKMPCKNCNKLILPTTIKKTNGYCMPCYNEKEDNKILASRYIEKPKVSIEDIDYFLDDNKDKWTKCDGLCDFLFQFYKYIENPDELPKLYNIIDLICEFEAEYNSSGLWLYLDHCGVNAEILKDALKTIGADVLLEIMEMATSIFPNNIIPWDDNSRFDILSENEETIDSLCLKYKESEENLLAILIDYIVPRKQEILNEINTYGRIIKYGYDSDR